MAIVSVQNTFEDVINDVESKIVSSESIWIARRFSHNENNQELYLINVSLSEDGQVKFDSADVELRRTGDHKYTITIKGDVYELVAAKYKIDTAKDDVTAVAITKNDKLLIVGNSSGDLIEYDTSTKSKVLEIKEAHYAGILQLALLPSDQVVLSVGKDFQTKLWLLETPSEVAVRTFLNQKKEITGIAPIGKGRNFMSSSLDGSVNLWECSTGKVVSKFQRIDDMEDPSTCLAIGSTEKTVSPQDIVGGDLLFECDDKVVYVGYQSGHIQQFSVAGHFQTSVKFKVDSGVSSLGVVEGFLVAGTDNGQVHIWNLSTNHHYQLALNENAPVANLHVEGSKNEQVTFVVSNGADLLLRVRFDPRDGRFHYVYLVGLSELFRIQLVSSNARGLVVATQEEIGVY